MTRNGKIARLPRSLRDQLNQRLAANEDGAALLAWLNASPDVQAILARDFAGEPITKQNLYEWRQGGFVEAQTRQELLAPAASLTAAAAEADAPACAHLIGNLVALLAVRYANLLARWDSGDNDALRVQLRVLHTFTRDLAALHRINQFAERQKMPPAASNRKERQPAKSAATARNPSEAGAHADDECLAPPRRLAVAASAGASATSAPTKAVTEFPPLAAAGTAADLVVAAAIASSQTDRIGLSFGNELPNRGSVGSSQVKRLKFFVAAHGGQIESRRPGRDKKLG